MKTTATVVSVNGPFATVQAVRTSACEGCHKMADGEKGCAVCSLVGSGKPMTARAENRAGAQVGDKVVIESASSRVLLDAALVFLLPLLICFLGWLIASAITERTLWRAVGAAAGLVCSFIGLRIYSGAVRAKRADVVITEIVGSTDRAAPEA